MGIEVKITFTNDKSRYYGGECVSGKVELIVPVMSGNEHYETKGIRIRIKGKAKWIITENKIGNNTYTTSQKYTFFETSYPVFGDEGTLKSGINSCNFSSLIPENVPSSYKNSIGEIYYQVKVIIQRDRLWNKKTKVPFEVQGILDVRKLEYSWIPIEISEEKSICCWCCMGGNVRFVLRMLTDKVLTNEELPFTLIVENQSSRRIGRMRVELWQRIKFTYESGNVKDTSTSFLTEVKGPAVGSQPFESWNDGKLQIPTELAPTNETGLVIRTEYYLQVVIPIQGCTVNLRAEVPVIVGHLSPLMSVGNEQSTYLSS